MDGTLLITGATGTVGSATVDALLERGVTRDHVVLAVRDRRGARQRFDAGFRYRLFDFEDPDTIAGSLDDVDRLFLVRPPAISNVKKYLYPVVDEAHRADVRQVVFLSLQGAEDIPVTPHHRVERYIKEHGIPFTFLRPGFYMQNLTTTHREEIQERDMICVPAGDGRTAFIDVRDIADVAALAMTEEGHTDTVYELTGNESLSYRDVAATLSSHLDREVTYTNLSPLLSQESPGACQPRHGRQAHRHRGSAARQGTHLVRGVRQRP